MDYDLLVSYIEDFMAKEGIPGLSVAIRKEGEEVFSRAFGLRSDKGDSLQPDDIFGIDSITSANSTSVVSGTGGTFQATAAGTAPIGWSLKGESTGVNPLLSLQN